MTRFLLRWAILCLVPTSLFAAPALLSHQGRIAVNGVNFDGAGQFKFALVNGNGSTTYWSNDSSSVAGSQPAVAVNLTVAKGLYSVLLGDTALTNMAALPAGLFDHEDVRLRIWFNDGANGFQLLSPDQRLVPAPYGQASSSQILLSSIVAPPVKPVVAWGENHDAQISVPPLANVAAIAGGAAHSLALLKSGTVVVWGDSPAPPANLTGVTHIAAGSMFSLARKSDGTVVGWGDNAHGRATPPAVVNAANVAAGEKHGLILRADGTLTAWGDNTFNQTTIPAAATNVTAIACGYDHCLALKADGTIVAWGRGDADQTMVPAGLTGVVAIAAGAYHSLAVKSDGTVAAWGWNLGGQSTVPEGLAGVAKVAGGYAFSLALKQDGTLVAWGDNSSHQRDIPAEATQVTAISAGASHALALRADLIPAQVARLDQENVFSEKIGIGRVPATNKLEVEGQASKTTAGNWAANSDRRIKTEIQPVTGALDKLERVRLVDFRYTDDYRAAHPGIQDKRYLNVIAQEFAEVFPDHVRGSGEKLPSGEEILQVDTYPLTIYSAAAARELHEKLKAQEAQITSLKDRLAEIEALLRAKPSVQPK